MHFSVKKYIFSIIFSVIIAMIGISLNFTEGYDFWVHKDLYNNIKNFDFLHIDGSYNAGFGFDFIRYSFSVLGFSFINFIFTLYFISYFIYIFYWIKPFHLVSPRLIYLFLIGIFGFPYITLFSGMRYALSLILIVFFLKSKYSIFSYFTAFIHLGAIPFIFVVNLAKSFKNVFELNLNLILVLLVISLAILIYFDALMPNIEYFYHLYLKNSTQQSRHISYVIFYNMQIIIPLILFYRSFALKIFNFSFFNFCFLLMFLFTINFPVLFDRVSIAFWLLLVIFSDIISIFSLNILRLILSVSIVKFILVIYSNIDGIYIL